MGQIRVGTVGYSYRDWLGVFYPAGSVPRRQFHLYCKHFGVCELTQFTNQMPDAERVRRFASQIKTDLRLFVRAHNTFTHCADSGLALSIAKHFRKALEPLAESERLAGVVASFPYAFKDSQASREYVQRLGLALGFEGNPLQLDFRHPSWHTERAIAWLRKAGLALVCIDEPELPGLLPRLAVATTNRVLVRLHGRNAETWWSGNSATRYDYSYSGSEMHELLGRYTPLIQQGVDVNFVFQNHWQAQAARNALEWQQLIAAPAAVSAPVPPAPVPFVENSDLRGEDDPSRPPTSLSFAEVKSRVTRVLEGEQIALDLPASFSEDGSDVF